MRAQIYNEVFFPLIISAWVIIFLWHSSGCDFIPDCYGKKWQTWGRTKNASYYGLRVHRLSNCFTMWKWNMVRVEHLWRRNFKCRHCLSFYPSDKGVAFAKSFWELSFVAAHVNGPSHLGPPPTPMPTGPISAQPWAFNLFLSYA